MSEHKKNEILENKPSEEIGLGSTLKKIRSGKGISATDFCHAMKISTSQLTKIEQNKQILSAELLIRALSYLDVSYDEFVLLLDNGGAIKAKVEIKRNIGRLVGRTNNQYLKTLARKAKENYELYNEPYFKHTHCILSALLILSETDDYEKACTALGPVRDYFSSVGEWYEYELELFANCHCLFPFEEAMKLGNQALAKVKDPSTSKDYNEFAHNLFIALGMYALNDKAYCVHAIDFANKARTVQTTKPLYTSVMVKIIQQIAFRKLESFEYDNSYFPKLIKGLKLMNLDDFADNVVLPILKKHEVPLENVEEEDMDIYDLQNSPVV